MLRALDRLDRFVALTRPGWAWLGELAVVVLGVHLAADRLDDLLTGWLAAAPLPWPDPEAPIAVATWCALAVELAIAGWAGAALVRAGPPVRSGRAWLERASVNAALAPLLFATAGLAGAWVVQMAVEDLLAAALPAVGAGLGWLVAALVTWRLAVPGVIRVARRPPPGRRHDGLAWAPLVLLVVALAVQHGLPIHGLARGLVAGGLP